eukprot:1929433-Rhodomonas_salina.2
MTPDSCPCVLHATVSVVATSAATAADPVSAAAATLRASASLDRRHTEISPPPPAAAKRTESRSSLKHMSRMLVGGVTVTEHARAPVAGTKTWTVPSAIPRLTNKPRGCNPSPRICPRLDSLKPALAAPIHGTARTLLLLAVASALIDAQSVEDGGVTGGRSHMSHLSAPAIASTIR